MTICEQFKSLNCGVGTGPFSGGDWLLFAGSTEDRTKGKTSERNYHKFKNRILEPGGQGFEFNVQIFLAVNKLFKKTGLSVEEAPTFSLVY